MALDGVRVVELETGIAGAYCTKLLVDAGADVVVVEPAGGDPARRLESPGLFDFLHASKRSVTPGTAGDLLAAADLVVAGAAFDVDAARRAAPHQVVVTISPFGRTGPWADRPASDLTLQATCGSIGGRGLPGEAPLAAGGRLGQWLAGTYAAVGSLAAVMEARRSGFGEHLDVAVHDAMVAALVTFPSVFGDFAATADRPPMAASVRGIEVPSIEPTADGWVTFTTNSAQQFSDFALLIGRPELADDDRYTRAGPRFARREEFWAMTRAYTRARTTAQVLEEAALLRIPVAPVLDGSTVPTLEQFEARGVFVDHPSGGFRQPRIPYLIDGHVPSDFGPVPQPGQHDSAVTWAPRVRPPADGPWRLPLEGTRVVDMTAWWAGPSAGHALACLGADVVKVESTVRPDFMRLASVCEPSVPQWWEWGPLAHAVNTNKRGVTIDLTRPEGHDLALRLLATADVVVENYTPRVMDQFGLGWDTLHRANEGLSMVRMPAFGLDGPWRDRTGFAQTMESLTGMAWVTGNPDGPPVLVRGAGDPLAGLHAAFASLVALWASRADGRGRMVEATMVEAVLNAAAEPIVAYQLTGEVAGRRGNRSPAGHAPQGVYPCRGDDEWVALTVQDDAQWEALVDVLGDPPDAAGSPVDLRSAETRRRCHDALDRWLAGETGRCEPAELVARLVAAGVPAAAVVAPADIADNPQLDHRGLFEIEDHPVTGRHRVPGLPFVMSRVASWIRTPSPLLGEHNDEVLAELGIGEAERAELRRTGVIGEGLASA